MDDTVTEDSNISSERFMTMVRRTRMSVADCKICGDCARYSYYGAVVCQSCKVFFRRNALSRQGLHKCRFNDECDISINSRSRCPACRLKKCFAMGMFSELIRGPLIKKSPGPVTTALVPFFDQNQPKQIPISNLLRSDQSTLSFEQWNLLSNLVHCYDQYSAYSFVQGYVRDQNALPAKLRFKYVSVREFFTVAMSTIQLGIEKNRDLLSLSLYDRPILLRNTAQYTSSIGGMFMLHQHHLFEYESFYKSVEMIFRPSAAAFTKRVLDQFDPDDTFIKLMLGVFAFLTINYIVYRENIVSTPMNTNAMLSIQNTYLEITWRYLLYKYRHDETVRRFSNLIRCIFLAISAIVEANDSDQFLEIVDTVIKRTEQTLCFQ